MCLLQDACILLQAGYLLREVLEAHPAMKVIITREVEKFLFRPGLQERARYYGVIFLNQMPLSHNPAQGTPHASISMKGRPLCMHNLSPGLDPSERASLCFIERVPLHASFCFLPAAI